VLTNDCVLTNDFVIAPAVGHFLGNCKPGPPGAPASEETLKKKASCNA
jgi:hypothetical protein